MNLENHYLLLKLSSKNISTGNRHSILNACFVSLKVFGTPNQWMQLRVLQNHAADGLLSHNYFNIDNYHLHLKYNLDKFLRFNLTNLLIHLGCCFPCISRVGQCLRLYYNYSHVRFIIRSIFFR